MHSYSYLLNISKTLKKNFFLSNLLKLVTEESRFKLLCVLKVKKHCVCELIDHLNMSQSLISHHLKNLKEAGIVTNEKQGLRVYYFLTDKGKKIIDLLFQIQKEVLKK